MRFRHPDGSTIHLAYCTNVHPAEDPAGVIRQLDEVAAEVRRILDVPRLGVGLWLAADVATRLRSDPHQLAELRTALERNRLEVVTLNGFPYGGFHADVVKRDVYLPDWTDRRRLDYTWDLVFLLGRLLPDDVETGAISTLPLGWAGWLDAEAVTAAMGNVARLADDLAVDSAESGRTVVVGLEPEPGCVLDTVPAVATAVAPLAPYIGVALDACHLAVEFEDPGATAGVLGESGVPAVKLQVASALRLADDATDRRQETLRRYDEPRFLHQTRTRNGAGVTGLDDVGLVDAAVADGSFPGDTEWRVHFHQPVHVAGEETTQDVLVDALSVFVGGPVPLTRILEVETYTWNVLPPERRPGSDGELAAALAQELSWTRDRLVDLGCVEVSG